MYILENNTLIPKPIEEEEIKKENIYFSTADLWIIFVLLVLLCLVIAIGKYF